MCANAGPIQWYVPFNQCVPASILQYHCLRGHVRHNLVQLKWWGRREAVQYIWMRIQPMARAPKTKIMSSQAACTHRTSFTRNDISPISTRIIEPELYLLQIEEKMVWWRCHVNSLKHLLKHTKGQNIEIELETASHLLRGFDTRTWSSIAGCNQTSYTFAREYIYIILEGQHHLLHDRCFVCKTFLNKDYYYLSNSPPAILLISWKSQIIGGHSRVHSPRTTSA